MSSQDTASTTYDAVSERDTSTTRRRHNHHHHHKKLSSRHRHHVKTPVDKDDTADEKEKELQSAQLREWLKHVDDGWDFGLERHATGLVNAKYDLKKLIDVGTNDAILEQVGVADPLERHIIKDQLNGAPLPQTQANVTVCINKVKVSKLDVDLINHCFGLHLVIVMSWNMGDVDRILFGSCKEKSHIKEGTQGSFHEAIQSTMIGSLGIANALKSHAESGLTGAKLDVEKVWKPVLFFENATLTEIKSEFITVGEGDKIFYTIILTGTFEDYFLMRHFPFDRHVFRVLVRHDTTKQKSQKVTFEYNMGFGAADCDCDEVEWVTGFPSNPRIKKLKPDPTTNAEGFCIQTEAERRSGFYAGNLMSPLFFIISLGFLSACIDPTDVQTRLSISLTLLLTAVAFKGATSAYLPRISYLTVIDFYIIVAFTTLGLIVVENATCSLIDPDNLKLYDKIWFSILGSVWVAWHIVLCSVIKLAWGHKFWVNNKDPPTIAFDSDSHVVTVGTGSAD
ncbi:hypothetical protein Pelo_12267 [Pelomyxa schiedti]|nr:hypothetical protein Pelo_12267 [Pelomyxa schiedti]